jgi:transposase
LDGFKRLPVDTLKLLFSEMDISITVKQVEAKYVNSGKGRPRYPVRSMLLALLFMRFEAIQSLRKLCRRLEKRRYARKICEFTGDRAPEHNTFSLFITRASPGTIESLFMELRDQALKKGIVDRDEAVKVSVDSTFMKAYSRRGRKGGIGRQGAQGLERRNARATSWAGEPTPSRPCQLFR